MALNVLYTKEMELILMTSNEKGWHCLAVKKLSTLRRITAKNNMDFYCLN